MAAPASVLFVHNYPMPFVTLDLALLRERYQVTEMYVAGRTLNPAAVLARVRRHDVVFAWFASLHSLLPLLCARLLRRPSLLVIGGYDVANVPEAGYGHQRGGLRRVAARSAMRLASKLVTISSHSSTEAVRNAGIDRARLIQVCPGLEPQRYPFDKAKEPMAVTVGNVNRENLKRKGLEAFAEAARLLPAVPFVLIGRHFDDAAERLRRRAPANLRLTGYLPDDALAEQLRRAAVYVQASSHEGFGLAVAEAMLCGCIPVVTRAGALPEVVGEAGVYLRSSEPEAVADGVRAALALDGEHRRRARERIAREFPLDRRRQRLFDLVDGLLPQSVT